MKTKLIKYYMKTNFIKHTLFYIISIMLIILSYHHVCNAQTPSSISSIDSDVLKHTRSIFYVVKMTNSTVLTTHDLIMDMQRIEKFENLSKEDLQKTYGDVKAYFQIVVVPKPGVKFVNFTELLNKFNVKEKYRNYPVIVDRSETEDLKTLLADLEAINKVVVNKEKKYIELITIRYNENMAF